MASRRERAFQGLTGIDPGTGKKVSGGQAGFMDLVDSISGAGAAEAQKKAAADALASQGAEAERARAFLREQADIGRGEIDAGTTSAAMELSDARSKAAGALGSGNENSLAALYGGQDMAAGALTGSPNRLAELYAGGFDALQGDPGYQFRLRQGQEAIENAASARGGRHGGNTLKALAEYNQNFATGEMDNMYRRAAMADQGDFARGSALANLYAGTGQQAAGIEGGYGSNLANLYTGTGSGLASLYSGAGTAKANLGIGAAANNTNLAGNMMQAYAAPVQYAGGAQGAYGNFFGGLAGRALGYGLGSWLAPAGG